MPETVHTVSNRSEHFLVQPLSHKTEERLLRLFVSSCYCTWFVLFVHLFFLSWLFVGWLLVGWFFISWLFLGWLFITWLFVCLFLVSRLFSRARLSCWYAITFSLRKINHKYWSYYTQISNLAVLLSFLQPQLHVLQELSLCMPFWFITIKPCWNNGSKLQLLHLPYPL